MHDIIKFSLGFTAILLVGLVGVFATKVFLVVDAPAATVSASSR